MESSFKHLQSAHCESGVAAALATHYGRTLSEPMAFGIGSGFFFAHLPFMKIMDLPLTSFRSYPGTILAKVFKRTSMPLHKQQFRSEEKALERLDALLAAGTPAGVQLSVFWLPYLPPQFRFQFNAHHAVVLAKGNGQYLISDPIGEAPVTCPVADFRRAWFAKGPLAPKGALYTSQTLGTAETSVDLSKAVRASLKETSDRMLRIPLPYFGVRGIRYLAKRMRQWPSQLKTERLVKLNLGQVVRMQEEIGTGGAGFRFLYAAFLQESSRLSGLEFLAKASDQMTEAGDKWRSFAIASARLCKQNDYSKAKLNEVAEILEAASEFEKNAFGTIDAHLGRRSFQRVS